MYQDANNESLQLEFKELKEIDIDSISSVQRSVFEDLRNGTAGILRT
ncbi:hypothetical protein [Paenibacillus glucanolyticus]